MSLRSVHRFLLNGVKWCVFNRICNVGKNAAFERLGSAETSKLQARDPLAFGGTFHFFPEGAFEPLLLRSAWL
jgi:hypothetical protein